MTTKIVLVEDETDQREIIDSILTASGYKVSSFGNAEDAIDILKKETFDLVISDWQLPGINGEELLQYVNSNTPKTGFILITAHGEASHAISVIRSGADDYLSKPFDKQTLLFTIKKLIYTKSLENENGKLKEQVNQRTELVDMIGRSTAMNRLFTRIEKAAPTSATLLISGESGTGKELGARAVHKLSNRADEIFLAVNCAAIPESIAEAELFGAEKGSYTGANKTRIGKFEASNNGTLFLDEVGELPLLLQSKLLRFLQEGTITRVGSNLEIKLDVRVIAATNRNLLEEVEKGSFREDLYYRLNVIPVVIPPLRQRQEDIPILINHFINYFSNKHNINDKKLSSAAFKQLLAYSWPGNVRQLRNSIERLILLSLDDNINCEDIDELELTNKSGQNNYLLPEQGLDWESHEKECLLQALSHCNNNRTQASKLLGLGYKAFLYRLDKYKI
ncbi:MAG: sigma-54-dependent Fis family transcriptional regulator [Kangiella sp.]|nr:MAG: sigma-54-dependent Fis family transcriptional regulator [Kangiella sp.]